MRVVAVVLSLLWTVLSVSSLPAGTAQAQREILESFRVTGDGDELIVPVTIQGK
jgi:hypothetical protein